MHGIAIANINLPVIIVATLAIHHWILTCFWHGASKNVESLSDLS